MHSLHCVTLDAGQGERGGSSGLPAVGVDEAARGAAAAAVKNGGVFRRKMCPR